MMEDTDHGAFSGMEEITVGAAAVFRREVEKAYRRGYQDALSLLRDDLVRRLQVMEGDLATRVSTVKTGKLALNSGHHETVRQGPKVRAKRGEIGRNIVELFRDGKGRTIKEAHDALVTSGAVASREGVAQELRNQNRFRRDGMRYFLLVSEAGEEPGGGSPGPSTLTT